MNAIRHEFLCERDHNWNKLASAGKPVESGTCPVCGAVATRHASLEITNRPLFRIEPSAKLDPKSGKVMGAGYFYLVLQSPDLTEEFSSRFPLKWDDAVKLAHDLRDSTYEKARRIFLRKADEVSGINEGFRAKLTDLPAKSNSHGC